MNYIDLFSGIGGFALGAYWAGLRFEKHYFSEVDPYCIALYQKRFPEAIPLYDVGNYNEWKLPKGEYVITGGFPCQSYSSAARGRNDEQKDKWPEMHGVIRKLRPRTIIAENVEERAIYRAREDIGYGTVLRISAASVGAAHRRPRFWLFADTDSKGEYRRSIHAEMAGLSRLPRVDKWNNEPDSMGMAHGIPGRMDRLRGLGNAIVPQVAAMIFGQINAQ